MCSDDNVATSSVERSGALVVSDDIKIMNLLYKKENAKFELSH